MKINMKLMMTQKKAIMMKMMMMAKKERPTRVIVLTQISTRKNQTQLKEMMTSTLKRTKNGESSIKTMVNNPLKNLEVQEMTMTLTEMRTTDDSEKYEI